MASSKYGIDKVQPKDRSFGFADTVWTWFGSGINTGSWYFGGMAAALGMSFVLQYSLLWIPLMMIPWAAVGYIGYRHGASTVNATRPSLGLSGSRLSGIAEFLVLIGWPSVNSYIAAISLTYVFSALLGWPAFGDPGGTWPLMLGILITAVSQGVIMVIGHEAIRYLERLAVILLLLLGGWETYVVLTHWDFSNLMGFAAPNSAHTVAFYIDLAFGFCWTWAQIADFSRFSKSGTTATVGSWLGVNLGQGWFMLVGALGVIGVALQTGNYDPNNSDPSSVLSALGLGIVAFIVLFMATISTNVTVLYGSGMGLIGAFRSRRPRKILIGVALLQLVLCFLPLAFTSFVEYFETFLTIIGGIFMPLWTIVTVDYYIVRRMCLGDADYFPAAADDTHASRIPAWNIDGLVSMAAGLAGYFTLSYGLTEIGSVTTASIPAVVISGALYLVLARRRFGGSKTRSIDSAEFGSGHNSPVPTSLRE